MENINKLKNVYKKFLNESLDKKSKINENKYLDIDSLYDITEEDAVKRALVGYKLSYEILENSIKSIYVEKDDDDMGGYYIDFDIKYKDGVDEELKKTISKFFDNIISDFISPDFFYEEDDDRYDDLEEGKKNNIFENV